MPTELATVATENEVEPTSIKFDRTDFEARNSLPFEARRIRTLFAEARKKGDYRIAPEYLSNMSPAEFAYLQDAFSIERQELERQQASNDVVNAAAGKVKHILRKVLSGGSARYEREMDQRENDIAAKLRSLNENYPKW